MTEPGETGFHEIGTVTYGYGLGKYNRLTVL